MLAATSGKQWTFLIYSAADNDMHDFNVLNLDDCEKVGSSDQLDIVAQLDHGGSAGCSRLHIEKDDQPGLHSPVLQEMGDVNMSDPKTLADFVEWGMKNYPAEHTMLIIADHGDGWMGAIQDDTSHAWMSLPDIERGLKMAREKTGKKLDIVGFDACLMASSEVAHQLRNEASYLVASEESEGALGWPYIPILREQNLHQLQRRLTHRAPLEPAALARWCVESSSHMPTDDLPTMSAIDLSKVGNLETAVQDLSAAIVATPTPTRHLRRIAAHAQAFDDTRDLYDFAQRLRRDRRVHDGALKQSALGVMNAVSDAVMAEQHATAYKGAHGLSVKLDNKTPEDYRAVSMAGATGWDQALQRIFEAK